MEIIRRHVSNANQNQLDVSFTCRWGDAFTNGFRDRSSECGDELHHHQQGALGVSRLFVEEVYPLAGNRQRLVGIGADHRILHVEAAGAQIVVAIKVVVIQAEGHLRGVLEVVVLRQHDVVKAQRLVVAGIAVLLYGSGLVLLAGDLAHHVGVAETVGISRRQVVTLVDVHAHLVGCSLLGGFQQLLPLCLVPHRILRRAEADLQ